MAKAHQAKVKKLPMQQSKNTGKRLFIDINSPNTPSLGGKTHWLLIVDDCTGYTWSYFQCQKSDLPKLPSIMSRNFVQNVFKSSLYIAIMQVKTQPLKKPVSGKGLVLHLTMLHLVHLNKTVKLKENLLHYMAVYEQC